jgi:chromosome partitioning protein
VLAPRRIAFINEKGGSAKTTLVANLGQLGKVLGVDNRRTTRSSIDLLLDSVLGDPALDLGPTEERPSSVLPLVRTRIPGLDVIVANKSLGLFPAWQDGDDSDPTRRLAETLAAAPEVERYDFVFFDAPPSFGPLTLNVLRAATEIVIPVPLGCAELVRTVATVRERYDHPDLRLCMVVPTFYRRTRLAQEILERLKKRFPKEIAHTVVGYHVKIDEAQSRGLSVFEYAPRDRGAKVMAELAEELELRGQVPVWEGVE